MFLENSKEVVSFGKDGLRSSNDVTENFPQSLNSLHSPTGSLQVAERWPVVAPDLYCPDCFKARENSSLALNSTKVPEKTLIGPALSPSQVTTLIGHLCFPGPAQLKLH